MRKLILTLLLAVLTQTGLSYADTGFSAMDVEAGCKKCKEPKQGPQGPEGPQGLPGPTGPTGPIGVTGPTGATGTSDCPNPFSFFSVINLNSDVVPPQGGVFFGQTPSTVVTSSGPAMTFNNTTGELTFNSTGYFQVTYGVQLDGGLLGPAQLLLNPGGPVTGSTFSTNGTSFYNSNASSSVAPVSVILQITTVPTVLTLINPDTDPLINDFLNTTVFMTIKQLK